MENENMLKIGGIYTYQEENHTCIIIPLSKNEYMYLPENQISDLNNKKINDYILRYVNTKKKIMKYCFSDVTRVEKIIKYLRIHYLAISLTIFSIDIKIEELLNGYIGMLTDENLSKLQMCVREYNRHYGK